MASMDGFTAIHPFTVSRTASSDPLLCGAPNSNHGSVPLRSHEPTVRWHFVQRIKGMRANCYRL
jgi:hypothetical protein